MDIVASGEVHESVATPFAAPYSLIYFFVDAGRSGRVTDVGIDFYEEVSSDNHRFALRVIDISREDSSSACYLASDELRCDMSLDAELLAVHVLTNSNILHLRCDDASLSVCHLSDSLSCLCTAWELNMLKS